MYYYVHDACARVGGILLELCSFWELSCFGYRLTLHGGSMAFQVTPPEPFIFARPEEWPKWIRRFEQFRLATGLKTKSEEKQISTLIYCMGDDADDILRSFRLSQEDSKKYETVRNKFETHFVKRRNVIFEQAKFNQRKQEVGESTDAFVMDLYSLAEHCDYRDLREELIRDRIVVGILDRVLSEKLQMDTTLTLEKAVSLVQQSESVKKQQVLLRGDKSLPGSVEAVTHSTQSLKCGNCGRSPQHDRAHCPARNATCNKCGKFGHFQVVCRSTMGSRGGGVEAVYLNTVTTEGKDEPWIVTLLLNGHPTKFKTDTGADVTVIPNTVLRKLHQVKLSLPDRQLLGPNNQKLSVKGCFKGNLKSKTTSTSQHVYVVPGLRMPLLGRPAIESLGLV